MAQVYTALDHTGAIFWTYGKLTVVNTTISSNTASRYAGGIVIWNQGAIVELSNTTN